MLKRFYIGLMAFVMGVALLGAGAPAFAQDEFDYNYDYTFDDDFYTTTSTSDELDAASAAVGLGVFACYMVFLLIIYVVMAMVLMTLGKKVGVTEPAWMAWVPVVNSYYMVRIANEEAWKFVLLFIPFVNIIYMIILWMKIAERRGFESWYGVLVIVPFVGWLVPLYLAWGEPNGSSVPVSTPSQAE